MRICEVLVGSAFAWRRATGERATRFRADKIFQVRQEIFLSISFFVLFALHALHERTQTSKKLLIALAATSGRSGSATNSTLHLGATRKRQRF